MRVLLLYQIKEIKKKEMNSLRKRQMNRGVLFFHGKQNEQHYKSFSIGNALRLQ